MVDHEITVVIEFTVSKMRLQGVGSEELLLVYGGRGVLEADLTDDSVMVFLEMLLEENEGAEALVLVLAALYRAF